MEMRNSQKKELKTFQVSWAENKYWVMSRSQQAYNDIRLMVKGNNWTSEKQKEYEIIIAELEKRQPTTKTLKVTYEHIWGYFKKVATMDEREKYKRLIKESDLTSCNELEQFLIALSVKYKQSYLLAMRWGLAN